MEIEKRFIVLNEKGEERATGVVKKVRERVVLQINGQRGGNTFGTMEEATEDYEQYIQQRNNTGWSIEMKPC
jgi:hypothetical protein